MRHPYQILWLLLCVLLLGCSRDKTDSDQDGMPDYWEKHNHLDLHVNDAAGDADGDGLGNFREYLNGSNPRIRKTKNDYIGNGMAGWIWQGTRSGVETESQIWQLTFPLLSPNQSVPSRFYPPPFPAQPEWDIKTTGDFNGDGHADFLWRHKVTGAWRVWWIKNGLRVGQNKLSAFDGAHLWTVVGAGDTDKDGDDDVILNNRDTGEILIWEMQNYANVVSHPVGTQANYVINRVGDFNKDGDVDFLLRRINANEFIIWEIEANAFVQNRVFSHVGLGWNPACAADADGDGDDDVLLVNDKTLQDKWYVMENHVRISQRFGSLNTGFKFLGCGDYDGDSDADTLWQRISDDQIRVVLQQNYGAEKQPVYLKPFGGLNPESGGYGFEYRNNSN